MPRRVAYFYDPDGVENAFFKPGHPMKPKRLGLTHELILSYNMHARMSMFESRACDLEELTAYHDPRYVEFLAKADAESFGRPRESARRARYLPESDVAACIPTTNVMESSSGMVYAPETWGVSPDDKDAKNNSASFKNHAAGMYNVGEKTDCPLFEDLFDLCRKSCGASIDSARLLNSGSHDVCVNWSGGLHHARKSEASGFCYANDIVLAIQELLKIHPRVLYVDADIHHGDGVEEAFYFTNRVMTFSLHKYGNDFFPGTGGIDDVGAGAGVGFSVNVPLLDGLDDFSFQAIFEPILEKIDSCYAPTAIVLQLGADSLAGDRLGVFDLSVNGHASCVRSVKKLNKPTLVLGGGGYTVSNVAKLWAFETAVLLDLDDSIKDEIPESDRYRAFYGPDFSLTKLDLGRAPPLPVTDGSRNKNTASYLSQISLQVFTNLETYVRGAPCVTFGDYVPYQDPPRLDSAKTRRALDALEKTRLAM